MHGPMNVKLTADN